MSNIGLWRVSGEFMGVQYYTVEGVRWAHGSQILGFREYPMGSWQSIIGRWRMLNVLMAVHYCSADSV